jgi:hypothetical protein
MQRSLVVMPRSITGLLLVSAMTWVGSAGSCVDFDGQLVRMQRDTERDRLDALFVYRNLHATKANLEEALEQADRLQGGARWIAFFSNWPFMFDLERKLTEYEGEDTPPLLALVDRNFEVTPGPLWLDDEHGLCSWQLVRIRNLEAVTEAANVALREVYLADDAHELTKMLAGWGIEDEAALARTREQLAAGWDLFRWEGSSIAFVLPATEEAWVQVKRAYMTQAIEKICTACEKTAGNPLDDAETAHGIELLARNNWSVTFRDGAIVLQLGEPSSDELRLVTPFFGKTQTASLVEALRMRGWDITDEDLDAAANTAYEEWIAVD